MSSATAVAARSAGPAAAAIKRTEGVSTTHLVGRILTIPDALIEEISTFLDQSISRIKPETPDRAKLSVDLANLALALGELHAPRDPLAATAAWRLAESQLRPYADYADGAILTALAEARYNLGDVQGATTLASRIRLSLYRHPAYANLANQLQSARGGGRSKETSGAKP